MKLRKSAPSVPAAAARYPGVRAAHDGLGAVVAVEALACDAVAAGPGAPLAQPGAAGALNAFGRPLLVDTPASAEAAAAYAAGYGLTGLRAAYFAEDGASALSASLAAAAGRRLTHVLHVVSRAAARQAHTYGPAHDALHALCGSGAFVLCARNAQEVLDLALVAHRLAEQVLTPGVVAQDAVLTSRTLTPVLLPEPELVRVFLGDPAEVIASPTPAQELVFGAMRRRIPASFDPTEPGMTGVVQGVESYAQGVAAQRPFFLDHVAPLADAAFAAFDELTGRKYARAAGHRLDDATHVLVALGDLVEQAIAVCDEVRATRKIRLGVLNLSVLRPFPADLVARLLAGKRAVTVLERVDEPLAGDGPLLREIRAALARAVEGGHAGLDQVRAGDVPQFFGGCAGLGGRPVTAGDLVAAVDNMVSGAGRRFFWLGVDFARPDTRLPKLQIWQDRVRDAYPGIADLALPPAAAADAVPANAHTIRVHTRGEWGLSALTGALGSVAQAAGLQVKATPRATNTKKNQPLVVDAVLADAPVRAGARTQSVQAVLAADPHAFRLADPLAGLADSGWLVVTGPGTAADFWATLSRATQIALRDRGIRLAFVQGEPGRATPVVGAFCKVLTLAPRDALAFDADVLRGYDDVETVDVAALPLADESAAAPPQLPAALASSAAAGRFWERVGYLHRTGQDGLADPSAAVAEIPAATSAMRDMAPLRFQVPQFLAEKCTGCGDCWAQCPDSALPPLVNSVEDVLQAGIAALSNGHTFDRLARITKHVDKEARRLLKSGPERSFSETLALAYETVAGKIAGEPEARAALDAEFAPVAAALAEFPLARTEPFFTWPEKAEKGTGGLLSITVRPDACKGCGICVESCPEDALVSVEPTADVLAGLRRNWEVWEHLPDTDDRHLAQGEEDEGTLATLLLRKANYLSMLGADGACPGCGEKTTLHLTLSAVHALLRPRVAAHVARLDDLVTKLDAKARDLLASDAPLDAVQVAGDGRVGIPLDDAKRARVERLSALVGRLKELRLGYRAHAGGIANAGGCTAAWASTYPHNPYPFPWARFLDAEAPALAAGLFEGRMRQMAAGFAAVRRAELELDDRYDPAVHDELFARFSWHDFTDDEFALCPPLLCVGGDGALGDTGLSHLSRLLASGKPVKVVVLDTQGHSDAGGARTAAGFLEGTRKEIALLALAHRDVFVLQSSQATPGHLLGGVLAGMRSRRPAVFVYHAACPPVHGLADDGARVSSCLAVKSRAFPLLRHDPDAGPALADRLTLEGNTDPDAEWTEFTLRFVDEEGAPRQEAAPLTVADWAAGEARFAGEFAREADGVPTAFAEFVALPPDERAGKSPFIWVVDAEKRRERRFASDAIVAMADDRLAFWSLLRELAGLAVPEAAFAAREEKLRAEFEKKLAQYPKLIARRLAEALLRAGGGKLGGALAAAGPALASAPATAPGAAAAPAAPAPAAAEPAPEPEPEEEDDEELALDPYIESPRCTACDECTRLNGRMFAYNEKKQAYVKDASAGTFRELVMAAEKCPVRIIHPGTPVNPDEPDLEKWIEKAKKFA